MHYHSYGMNSNVGMRYKSEIYEVVHQDATANFEVGAISEAEMIGFDERKACARNSK